ncbi:hypothetical protein F3J35_08735 [Klebsiella sp. Ap-874]|nr:hypothetical protein [Klebsiella sp. Ap-874]
MQMITRKKPAFTELYQTGVLTRMAVVNIAERWRLFSLWRHKNIGVDADSARGEVLGRLCWTVMTQEVR